MVELRDCLIYVSAADATDGALHFPAEILLESGHLCGDSTDCRQSESSRPARGLCGVCTAEEGQVCSPCLPFMMCLTLQLSTSLEICCRALRIAAAGIQTSFHATACKLGFQCTKIIVRPRLLQVHINLCRDGFLLLAVPRRSSSTWAVTNSMLCALIKTCGVAGLLDQTPCMKAD